MLIAISPPVDVVMGRKLGLIFQLHDPEAETATVGSFASSSNFSTGDEEAVAVRSTQTGTRGRRRKDGQIRSFASSSNFTTRAATGRRPGSGVEGGGSEIYFPFSSLHSPRSSSHPSPIRLPKDWHHLPAQRANG